MASSRKSRSAEDPAAIVAASVGRHVAAGATLCAGLSGGVDSVVLLHLLNDLRQRSDFSLGAAHVHHGLNPAANDWVAFCSALCERLGIAFSHFKVELPDARGAGLEAAARSARFAAMAQLEADWLVLGHHRDDQAETVLFKLLRGAGLKGMAGIAEAERRSDGLSLLRPMLGLGRAAILDYARHHGLEWVEDDSNADERFARNFLRKTVLPELNQRFPAAAVAISRAADHLRESQALLDELAALDAQAVACGEVMRLAALGHLSGARQRNLIRWHLSALGFPAPDESHLCEAIRQLDGLSFERPLYFPLGNARLCHYRGSIWIEAAMQLPEPRVAWNGAENLVWGRDEISFGRVTGQGVRLSRLEGRAVVIDFRRPGDRMQISAGRPHRSFKNLVQEAGIPPWLRDVLPILRVDGTPVWIAGVGVALGYACPPNEEGVVPKWSRAREGVSLRCDRA